MITTPLLAEGTYTNTSCHASKRYWTVVNAQSLFLARQIREVKVIQSAQPHTKCMDMKCDQAGEHQYLFQYFSPQKQPLFSIPSLQTHWQHPCGQKPEITESMYSSFIYSMEGFICIRIKTGQKYNLLCHLNCLAILAVFCVFPKHGGFVLCNLTPTY